MTHRGGQFHITGWWAILLAPIAVPLAILAGLWSKPKDLTPSDVANYIRGFLDGTGGEWDWDDFTSVPIANPLLDQIRMEAERIPLPLDDAGRETLRALLARLRALGVAEA